jgi:elongation factor G
MEDSTEEEINIALRAAVMDMAIIPMIAGSSFKIHVNYVSILPSPMDKEGIEGFILMMLNY